MIAKKIILATAALAAFTLTARAQEADETSDGNSYEAAKDVKTGWNFGPLPAVGYNSDLGFQLGALCDIYYYGDGSVYPGYVHKFNVEASYYFKGAGNFHFFYDSKYLIPGGIRLTAAVSYLPNAMMNFFGFNGAASPYFPHLDRNRDTRTAFYSFRRDAVRVLADFQGTIKGPLRWAAGAAFWHYRIGDINRKDYDGDNTLFNLYKRYGIIGENEAGGGSHFELKGGLVYDTRDHEAAPSRGIWADAVLYGSPDMFGGGKFNYLKAAVHFRHYVPVWEDRIVFAYHLAYQGLLAGEAPFYMQTNITTPYLRQIRSEGLGSINTLRGMLLNRIVSNGYVWSNFEMRFRIVSFRFIKQQWYVATNPFFDAGTSVQPFRLDRMRAVADNEIEPGDADLIYSGKPNRLHMSAGIGIKLVMNRNFIVSAEWAKPFDPQDGPNGLNIGLNYIF